jgi:hypothetical protein
LDSTDIIINESMAKVMGKEGKDGQSLSMLISSFATIIGIMKDFIYNDVYGEGLTAYFIQWQLFSTVMAVRFKPNVNLLWLTKNRRCIES